MSRKTKWYDSGTADAIFVFAFIIIILALVGFIIVEIISYG